MASLVKFMHSGMTGAPALTGLTVSASGTAQGVFNWLKGVMLDGFNSRTPTGVVVSGGVATATYAVAHGYEVDVVLQVSGLTPAGLNGEKRVLSVPSGTTLTFSASGVSDQTATGTATTLVAPLGWTPVGTLGTTLPLTLQAPDTAGLMPVVTVASSVTGSALVTGYRAQAGGVPQSSFGSVNLTVSSNTAGSPSTAQWTLVGDGRTVYFVVNAPTASTYTAANGMVHCWGDFKPLSAADTAYAALVRGGANGASGSDSNCLQYNSSPTSDQSANLKLSGTLGGALPPTCYEAMEHHFSTAGISGNTSNNMVPAYPNGPDNSLILSRKAISDGTCLRGHYRGFYVAPQNCASSFGPYDRVVGQGAMAGKRLLAVRCGSNGNTTGAGVVFFDITGTWD